MRYKEACKLDVGDKIYIKGKDCLARVISRYKKISNKGENFIMVKGMLDNGDMITCTHQKVKSIVD